MQIRQKIGKFRTLNLRKKLCYLGEIETKVYRNFYNKKKSWKDKWDILMRVTSKDEQTEPNLLLKLKARWNYS